MKKPKILFMDIETAPTVAYVWSLYEPMVGLNQIKQDWYILSFSAKWADSKTVIYHDQRNSKNLEDDKHLLEKIWKLLDEADIVVTHNGVKFDNKKINARFVMHGLKPPSSFKNIDTLKIAKAKFAFTSNKLEYLTNKLCTKYKKLKVKKYQGFELWRECMKGNKEAWKEMARYNKQDVLALEELYHILLPWDNSVNFQLYSEELVCKCGNKKFIKKGFTFTTTGKYQKYRCTSCGSEKRGRENLLTLKQKKSLLVPIK